MIILNSIEQFRPLKFVDNFILVFIRVVKETIGAIAESEKEVSKR